DLIREVRSEGEVSFPPASVTLEGAVMRVALPAPLAPESEQKLSMTFIVKLPDRALNLSGLGYMGRHVDAFRWYPRPCTLTEQGWSLPSDRGQPPDRGDFEVTLTVPAQFQVEATGQLVESHVEDAIKRVRYSASGIHDFSWTADPNYTSEKNLYQDVEILALQQPYMMEKTGSLLNIAKFCVDFNRNFLQPYPYKHLVISTTPYGAGETAWGAMLGSIPLRHPVHLDCLRERSCDPELELLKAWSRLTVFESPWETPAQGHALHEGLARYLFLKMVEEAYGRGACGTALGALEKDLAVHLVNHGFGLHGPMPAVDPKDQACCGVLRSGYDFMNLSSVIGFHQSPFFCADGRASLLGYRVSSINGSGLYAEQLAHVKDDYAAGAETDTIRRSAGIALALASMEKQVGWETMQKVLRAYLERSSSKAPSLEALLDVVAEYAGAPMVSLAAAMLQENVHIDFAVVAAQCTSRMKPQGFITQARAGEQVQENLERSAGGDSCGSCCFHDLLSWGGEKDRDTTSDDGGEEPDPPIDPWHWKVTVRNLGNTVLPVSLRLDFEGGETELREWDGSSATWQVEGRAARRLISAVVDPEGKYVLDLNRLNNQHSVLYEREGVMFLAGWFQFWVQNYLNGWAFLN
ncbi:MAG: hypothetical protein KJ645_08565, partial [Planctomycetes bacterium]|nr:hypothetical protein [Planctomycetota bacterium]